MDRFRLFRKGEKEIEEFLNKTFVIKDTPQIPYTPEEDIRVLSGIPDEVISLELGRSVESIQNRRRRLLEGEENKAKRKERRIKTQKDKSKAKDMALEGFLDAKDEDLCDDPLDIQDIVDWDKYHNET